MGWSEQFPASLHPFWRRRSELTVQSDTLFWGVHVIVPVRLWGVVKELYQGHPGVVKMKSLARSQVWWPELDSELETWAKACHYCQVTKTASAKVPLHPWAWLTTPWQHIHVDFAEPVRGKMLFIAVEAHSKWPEAVVMNSTAASQTIVVLPNLFGCNELPEQLMSDNGPQFVSDEFQHFLAANVVKHAMPLIAHCQMGQWKDWFRQWYKRWSQAAMVELPYSRPVFPTEKNERGTKRGKRK